MNTQKTLWIILITLIVILVIMDLGLFSTNRFISVTAKNQIEQAQAERNETTKALNVFIGELKSVKDMSELKELLKKYRIE